MAQPLRSAFSPSGFSPSAFSFSLQVSGLQPSRSAFSVLRVLCGKIRFVLCDLSIPISALFAVTNVRLQTK
jgi:hypothetical protein